MTTIADQNIRAEARGHETGHRAFVQPDGSIRVKSDTYPGKHYVVTFARTYIDGPVTFTCAPHGEAAYHDDHLLTTSRTPGLVPCMHAAVAARRLEREGLARFTRLGEWVATAKAAAVAEPPREVGAALLSRFGRPGW